MVYRTHQNCDFRGWFIIYWVIAFHNSSQILLLQQVLSPPHTKNVKQTAGNQTWQWTIPHL